MTHQSRSAEIAATVADPAPVLQLIVVSAVEILQGAAGVIALLEDDRLVPRASYGLPAGALAGLHPRLDRAILNVLGQLGEQVSVLYLPSGFGDWARRYPIATKRVTRAVLRAADVVAKDRAYAAREYVKRFVANPRPNEEDITNEVIRDLSYDWRDLDPEETLRFFALRLADAKLKH